MFPLSLPAEAGLDLAAHSGAAWGLTLATGTTAPTGPDRGKSVDERIGGSSGCS